jgi:hypothetical protein
MHGPTPHHPLTAAARETMAVARETKSPLFERVAIITMIGSALTTTALAALQAIHMLRRDLKEDRREEARAPRRHRRRKGRGMTRPPPWPMASAAGAAARSAPRPPVMPGDV